MGNMVSCCHYMITEKHLNKINEGENFITDVLSQTKLNMFRISELHKFLMNSEVSNFESLNEQDYYLDFAQYSSFTNKYLFETNINNKYYQLHSIFFSFLGSSFEYSGYKINCLNILKTLLIFTNSDLDEKIKYFIYYSKNKINKDNFKGSLKSILREFLNFILYEVTIEMTRIVMNQERSYKINLSSMNTLCQAYKQDNIIKFIDSVLINANFDLNSSTSEEMFQKELREFLSSKQYLFNFTTLRNLYLSVCIDEILK